jgi:hypothetical protein
VQARNHEGEQEEEEEEDGGGRREPQKERSGERGVQCGRRAAGRGAKFVSWEADATAA